MYKEKHVIVPQSDIDMIEAARKDLCNLAEDNDVMSTLIISITSPMYRLTHRKYKESKWMRFKSFFKR